MGYTRLDLRNLVRRELSDTGSPPLWSDAQLNDDLQAALQAFSQFFPSASIATFTSGANQTALLLGSGVVAVSAVVVDGVTMPGVPDQATLYEPGRAITVYYAVWHTLPTDDVTAVTVPDGDIELPVLYACDRLVRSAHTDAIKRGAPGAWADAKDDNGYALRYKTALWMRRDHVVSRTVQALQ